MSITLDVQDLDNYPGNVKRVTVDVTNVVPIGQDGDEKLALYVSTTAYSDVINRIPIQSLYVTTGNVGWSKSSGRSGINGKFALNSSAFKLGISLDATISGTRQSYDGRGIYDIELEYNSDGSSRSGEIVAEDIQNKIRNIKCVDADAGFQLAYSNCSVEYKNSKFIITSGTISNYYYGEDRSSVKVYPAIDNDCSAILGFDHQITSEELESLSVVESPLISDYTAGDTNITIGTGTGVVVGDAMYITDGTNSENFIVNTINGNVLGIDGLLHSYLVANNSYVQILRPQDPDVRPNSPFEDIDGLMRYMTKNIINQIDFSG